MNWDLRFFNKQISAVEITKQTKYMLAQNNHVYSLKILLTSVSSFDLTVSCFVSEHHLQQTTFPITPKTSAYV